jgi:general secretion pathway protein H
MRTSATGNSGLKPRNFHPRETGNARASWRSAEFLAGDPVGTAPGSPQPCRGHGGRIIGGNGFTLIELLIVLVLLGLASAAVVVALPDPRGSVTAEAERFAARAKAAQDRAVIESRAVAIRVTGAGYGFDRRRRGEWEKIDSEPFTDQRWGEGVAASVGGSDAARIVFDSTGIADPSTVTLSRGDEQATITIAQDGSIDVAA